MFPLIVASSCSPERSGPPPSTVDPSALVVTVSADYTTGSFAAVALDDHAIQDTLFATSGDPGVAVSEGMVFQFNRYGYDSVRRYTADDWSAPLWEISTGDYSNPVDAAVCAGSVFVALYDAGVLLVLDPETGRTGHTITLDAFADGDGLSPEPDSLVVVGEHLFVGLNRLDRDAGWIDAGGVVAELDCASYEVVRSWPIGANTRVAPWDETRLLVTARAFGDDPGGLYLLDPDLGPSPVLSLSGTDREAVGVAAGAERAVLLSSRVDLEGYAIDCVDLTTGAATLLGETTSFVPSIAANDRGEAWLAYHWGWVDPTSPAGLHVIDIDACAWVTDAPIELTLAPYGIGFL